MIIMSTPKPPVIVVGAGGAGFIATWRVAAHGIPTVLLEKNRKAGIKILISGGGKCNVTHEATPEDFLKVFSRREARFLKYAVHRFSSSDLLELLHTRDVRTLTRPNGRVFPASENARDIVRVLDECVRLAHGEIRLHTPVTQLHVEGGRIAGVIAGGTVLTSSQVIIATGGVSYPKTGTTGDGFRWAAELGHTIVPLGPALAPIGIDPPLPAEWRGIALRHGRLAIFQNDRELAAWDDDLLISHEGVSGPAALELSRSAALAAMHGPCHLRFDFFPHKEFDLLDQDLLAHIDRNRGRTIGTLLEGWLPNRMVDSLLSSIGVEAAERGYNLSRDARRGIVHLLKGWKIGKVDRIDIERGEVTAGGLALDEVDPRTMRSKKVRGLYLCGEVLDVAGPVGGYNLQAAFSTGYVAGESAAEEWGEGTEG